MAILYSSNGKPMEAAACFIFSSSSGLSSVGAPAPAPPNMPKAEVDDSDSAVVVVLGETEKAFVVVVDWNAAKSRRLAGRAVLISVQQYDVEEL